MFIVVSFGGMVIGMVVFVGVLFLSSGVFMVMLCSPGSSGIGIVAVPFSSVVVLAITVPFSSVMVIGMCGIGVPFSLVAFIVIVPLGFTVMFTFGVFFVFRGFLLCLVKVGICCLLNMLLLGCMFLQVNLLVRGLYH